MDNELQRHNRELVILNKIASELNSEVDLPHALQSALENIVELFGLETGWIFLYDGDDDRFYAASTLNLPPALADHPRRLGGTCYCLDDYRDGVLAGSNINAILCSRLKDLKKGTSGLLYHASIPLNAKDKKFGVLNVASPDWKEIAEDDLGLLHTVGELMSMAIERARLFSQSVELGAIYERNRLAREIHDTIAQGLAAITLKLETVDALLDAGLGADKVQAHVRTALDLARANMEEARRSVLDLRATSLENRTLPEALRALLEQVDADSKLQTHCEIMGSGPPLPTRISAGLYRIAQEAITNIRKHAHAQHVDVKLILTAEHVQLIVEDDGDGFDPSQVEEGRFGLIGLNERAKILGGTLSICSTPNSGTVIDVNVPLIHVEGDGDDTSPPKSPSPMDKG